LVNRVQDKYDINILKDIIGGDLDIWMIVTIGIIVFLIWLKRQIIERMCLIGKITLLELFIWCYKIKC